ncbi:glycosyltransferase family 2 protein [Microbacterium oryzae]|uniref:glycosyltransferase n=1 Tax=Microbacterium oryzae TaxID=743009 RepID=UPI0025AF5384|nr:glycosyltransferase family 2 protein [Microbacterium oryzae]MDN3311140.1 glycosyltransferase family 2 protein [Microbacterium oryzae]
MPSAAPHSPAGDARVSVVIPVKDDAPLLRRCLQALAAQTRVPDEIVVVDNASRDTSASVAREAGARVVVCAMPGIPAAAATGYDAANGDVILRLDADCVPPSDWVEAMTRAFGDPAVVAVTGAARFIDGPPALRAPLLAAYLGSYTAVSALALGHRPLFGSNMGFRRDAWRRVSARVHRDDPEIHDDFDLSFHLGEHHRIRRVAHPAVGMSMRPFRDRRDFLLRRVPRGFRTVFRHWPDDLPPVRCTRRALRAARRRARIGAST